jgi:hypothetical protein
MWHAKAVNLRQISALLASTNSWNFQWRFMFTSYRPTEKIADFYCVIIHFCLKVGTWKNTTHGRRRFAYVSCGSSYGANSPLSSQVGNSLVDGRSEDSRSPRLLRSQRTSHWLDVDDETDSGRDVAAWHSRRRHPQGVSWGTSSASDAPRSPCPAWGRTPGESEHRAFSTDHALTTQSKPNNKWQMTTH